MPARLHRWIRFVTFSSCFLSFLSATAQLQAAGIRESGDFGKVPLHFEPNMGQAASGVEFLARADGYIVFLTREGLTLKTASGPCNQGARRPVVEPEGMGRGRPFDQLPAEIPCHSQSLRIRLEGASAESRIVPEGRQEGVSNYLNGRDPSRWLTKIPQFQSVRISEVYPGIDMVLRPNATHLRYDFEVKPSANPERIRLSVEGSTRTELTGDAVIHHLANGRLEQRELAVWQGQRKIPGASFVMTPKGEIGFQVDGWDRKQKLVIDPTLVWSTYAGGPGPEYAKAVAVGPDRNAYVAGQAQNLTFPVTAGVFDTAGDGFSDVFLTRLNANGTALVYSTFLGGSLVDEVYGLAVDAEGNAYVAGATTSPDFPVTPGSYDMTPNGASDVFVTKVNPSGTRLLYSTLLGGSREDTPGGIAITASGAIFVTGYTYSVDFPVTDGAFDTSWNASTDGFVTKLDERGATLVYSTFLAGSNSDYVFGIAIDSGQNAYLTGATYSSDFPVTPGAFDPTFNGGYRDVFVSKLNPSGTALVYSTFLGGTRDDEAYAIAVDTAGNAHVTGTTASSTFPRTAGAFDTTHNGSGDAFVIKLNANGTALVYGTFLGGSSTDEGHGIAIDSSGNALVAGNSGSSSFPVTAGSYDTVFNGAWDIFLTKLNPNGTGFVFSTFLGGSYYENVVGLALDSAGACYLTGNTHSLNFPVTAGAHHTVLAGDSDCFVTRVSPDGKSLEYSTYLGGASSDNPVEWVSDMGLDATANVYILGTTSATGFPTTPGAVDTTISLNEVFIRKLNSTGTALVYATFLGGSSEESARALAVDAAGNVYASGITLSVDFPVTQGAHDTTLSGYADSFVTKLSPDGTALIYSTLLGGASNEEVRAIAVDASGCAYVTGQQAGPDFPVTVGAFDTTHNGDDSFVTKLNPAGTALVYSTFLGGSAADTAEGISLDPSGRACVTGSTRSADFPVTDGAYDTTFNGGYCDSFVTMLNVVGTGLVYSTFLGGAQGADYAHAVAVDATGSAYVTGYTNSSDFPATEGAFDGTFNGSGDVFVTKLNPSGSALDYSTFLGASGLDEAVTIAVDEGGRACVAGRTTSPEFPTTSNAYFESFIGSLQDAFISKLNSSGSRLSYSTFFGGSGDQESISRLALDSAGSIYVMGLSGSLPFPITGGAYQERPPNSPLPGFVSKLDICHSGVEISATASVCATSSGSTASVPDAGSEASYTWEITGGTITSQTNSNSITYAANASGTVELKATVFKDGCTNSGTKLIPIQTLPAVPVLAIPSNGSTYQGISVSWTHPGGAWYDVYLDTVQAPEKLTFSGETSQFETLVPSWMPGVRYYWKVVARTACGNVSSPVSTFVAGTCPWPFASPVLTSPASGATGLDTTATLQWNSLPATAHYDVYIGTSTGNMRAHRVVKAPVTSVSVRLSPGTTYYWRVTAVPVCGSASAVSSETRSFTTEGAALEVTGWTPTFFNRWETGLLRLFGHGFNSTMRLFTEMDGGAAGTLVPELFSNTGGLSATLVGNAMAKAGRYDVGVTEGPVERVRLLQALALRAFTDVTENDYYYASSARIADAGIMESDFDPSAASPQFSPSANVTRALMAEYLARSYQYWRTRTTNLPGAVCVPVGAGSADFPDVHCSHPNWLAIHWIKVWGVTTGAPCTDGLCFNPEGTLNRAEMVTFLERLRQTGVLGTLLTSAGEKDPGCASAYPACKGWADEGGVMDVATWPRREANVAFHDRITSGCSGSVGNNLRFCPSDPVTRGQIGEFLARTLGLVPMP